MEPVASCTNVVTTADDAPAPRPDAKKPEWREPLGLCKLASPGSALSHHELAQGAVSRPRGLGRQFDVQRLHHRQRRLESRIAARTE